VASGPRWRRKFFRGAHQLAGDRAVPALKVPAGLPGIEPSAHFAGQPALRVVRAFRHLHLDVVGRRGAGVDLVHIDDLELTIAVAEQSCRHIEGPLRGLRSIEPDDSNDGSTRRADRRPRGLLHSPFGDKRGTCQRAGPTRTQLGPHRAPRARRFRTHVVAVVHRDQLLSVSGDAGGRRLRVTAPQRSPARRDGRRGDD
jgi:hypothetical protein